jgi:hypothetical protein
VPISDDPLDLLEERSKNLAAMLPDNELRPALDAMLQQMVLVARLAAVIRRVADIPGPLPPPLRDTLRQFGENADRSIRTTLALAESEIAKHAE